MSLLARTARAPVFAAVWALLLCFVLVAPSRAALTFPPLTGRVVDDAHILSPQIQADLTQKLSALQAQTSRQLIVVTLPSLQGDDIADYGYQLGRAWGIGQKGINNGTLFIVAPTDRKVRIEVGYGLEGILTDGLTSVILQRSVLPKFRAGDMPGGVVDGTQALVDQLSLDPSTAEQKAAEAQQQAVQPYGRYGGRRPGGPFGLIVVIFVIVLVLRSVLSGGGGRGGGGLGWLLGGMFLGNMMGGGGRGGNDDFGGGFGGGGGGFGGGGGGSFGGGGSSGSW
jgi:uncharacterized protein